MQKGIKISLWVGGIIFGIIGLGAIIFLIIGLISAGMETAGIESASYVKSGLRSPGLPSSAPMALEQNFAEEAYSPAMMDQGIASETQDRLIIKNGWLSVVTNDVPAAVERITKFVEGQGGFVVSSNISGLSESPRATVILRVKAEHLDETIAFTKEGSDRVVSEEITGEDVTEEYVDQKAHLENLEAQERRFREILQQANTVKDILEVQTYINNTRDEINRSKARIKYLEESAAFARLAVDLATDEMELPVIAPGQKWRPVFVIKQAIRGLIRTAQALANLVIRLAIFAPIWAPIALIIWWFVRRRRRKN